MMDKTMIDKIERDYWEEKASPIDMAEVFDLAKRALDNSIPVAEIEKILKRYEGRMNPTAYFSLEADIVNIEALEQEPTTENCESCRYYGSHHEVCNYCYECSLWTEQEPTTKNDLEVDCISKQAVLNKILKFSVTDGRSVSVTSLWTEVNGLPSATPQEPRKGQWIDGHCSECGCDIPAYIIDWKWQKDMDAKFCPQCGADMREVEE